MTTVASIKTWRTMSLNQLSEIFGIARETVTNRINSARISPVDTRNGHPVYDVQQVYQAIRDYDQPRYDTKDPDSLPPKERRDWYEGNNAKLKYEKELGKLVDAEQARQMLADMVKPGIQLMETIPDKLERDFSISVLALLEIEKMIDELRDQWAIEIETQCNLLPN